jgi:hypothetical protein
VVVPKTGNIPNTIPVAQVTASLCGVRPCRKAPNKTDLTRAALNFFILNMTSTDF